MNWFKENKFLAGLLIATVIGAAVLGFLMMSAQTAFAEAQQRYDEHAAELTRLQNSAPFPDANNLKKMEALRTDHFTAITTLQKDLAAAEIPLKPMTPEQFKDALDNSVKRIVTKAAEVGTKLPEKFYMAMDRYEREVPKPEAAAPLGRQLAAMELAMTQLLDNRVTEVAEVKRESLAEEGLPPGNSPSARSEPEAPKSRQGKDENSKDLVTRNSFDVGFVAEEVKAHNFINSLVNSKQQFFIPRSVTVKNERTEGPPRVDSNAASNQPPVSPPRDPANPTPPDPNSPPSTAAGTPEPVVSKYIVGDEKLQIAMRIDVVHFSEPTKAK